MNSIIRTTVADYDTRLRRARLFFSLIGILMLFDHGRGLFIRGTLYSGVVLFVAIPLAAYFLLRGKIEISGLTLVGFAAVDIFLYISKAENVAIQHAIIFGSLTGGVAALTFSKAWLPRINWVFAIIGFSFILFDYLWPYERQEPLPINQYILLSFVVLAVIAMVYFFLRDFPNYRVQTKFLIAVSGLVALSIGVNTIVARLVAQQFSIDDASALTQSFADSFGLTIGDTLKRDVDVLRLIAVDDDVSRWLTLNQFTSRGDTEEIIAELRAVEAEWEDEEATATYRRIIDENETSELLLEYEELLLQDATNLTLVNAFGRTIAHSGSGEIERFYFGDEHWFSEVEANGYYLGLPVAEDELELEEDEDEEEEEEGEGDPDAYLLRFALAIYDEGSADNPELLGMILAESNLEGIGQFIEVFDDESGAFAFDIAASEEIAIDLELEDGTFEFEDNAVSAVEAQIVENGYVVTNYEGVDRVVALGDISATAGDPVIDNLNWQVIAFQDEASALAAFDAQGQVQRVIGIVILAIGAAASVFVASLITNPLNALTATAERFTAGDLSARAETETEDEVGRLAAAFNTLAAEVQGNVENLEANIQNRTQALTTSNRIAQTLARSLDQDEIIKTIVYELKSTFDFYHVHIYLVDQATNKLVMAGGSGQVGQKLLENRHSLSMGTGLVGRAAATQAGVLVPDVSQDPNWSPNRLLPDTKSELAVPVVLNEQVLGVIDVQDNEVNGLSEQDQELLETIANQLSTNLRNAQLFETINNQATYREKLIEIGDRLRDAQTIQEVLEVAGQEVATYLKVRTVAGEIRPFFKETNGQNGNPPSVN
ncbi:MAG: GAF domain-containing protein [Ardenticatenaceae bacterium]|nr:GAF domain-containing protein [Ardenticatenaceae bacterium]